jgi:hypothetical protein
VVQLRPDLGERQRQGFPPGPGGAQFKAAVKVYEAWKKGKVDVDYAAAGKGESSDSNGKGKGAKADAEIPF